MLLLFLWNTKAEFLNKILAIVTIKLLKYIKKYKHKIIIKVVRMNQALYYKFFESIWQL